MNPYITNPTTKAREASMKGLDEALEELGLPSRDGYDLPTSERRFPDGGHYRIEISGVERVSALETLLKEADRLSVPVHRIIATVGGATYLTRSELRDLAQLARDHRIEVVMTLGPRRAWDSGRQLVTEEGLVSGMRLRGMDQLRYWIRDFERCLEAGFRGALVADEGALWLMDRLRDRGVIPADSFFKLSVFAGQANPAGARIAQSLGADTFNPLADLTIPMLAAIRSAIHIPMDVYLCLVSAMGGFVRFYEAAEIARVAAPCYFKIEPGTSEAEIYAPWNPPALHDDMIRERVRNAAVAMELIERENPEIVCSPAGAEDLTIPHPA
ncbi:MAG: hypothetical protein ACQEXJ_06245 [Myxococcota bacterium]